MKVTTTTAILAAALGVAAHPSGIHGHAHKHMHRSLEQRDFVMAVKPAETTSSSAAPAPKATAAPIQDQEVSAQADNSKSKGKGKGNGGGDSNSGSGSGSGSGSSSGTKQFCGGVTKRATLANIAYAGNVGVDGNYGCNMMTVDSTDGYDYTATFKNAYGKGAECKCWNKIGPDGGINGFWKGNEALSFDISAGGSQVVAFQSNTQGGCACNPGGVPVTGVGQYAGTWLEMDMGSDVNDGCSGADASALVAAAAGMSIPGMKVCGMGKQCSVINPGGTGTNAYLAGMEAEDGVGLNLAAGPAHLEVTVGYSG